MSETTALNISAEFLTVMGALRNGYEVKLTVNGHQFALVEDGNAIVASIDGESHYFVWCTEDEIRNVLADYRPGSWK